jgi:hypothetical protein
VQAAVASGALTAERLQSFHKLAAEREHQDRQLDVRAILEEKRKARIGGKALRKRLKEKGAK